LRVFAIHRVPAPPYLYFFTIDGLPVVCVEYITGIDLEGEQGPKKPRRVISCVLVRIKINGVTHAIKVLALGRVAQAVPLRLNIIGIRFNDTSGKCPVVYSAVVTL